MDIQAALYARVSSEQQASAHTVASQVAALRERIAADGLVLRNDLAFVDEGYSGATLIRPALERLRDAAAAGGVDRLYVHSPDRLARKYAYQALLIDELRRAGVAVVFLNRALGQSPEDEWIGVPVPALVSEALFATVQEQLQENRQRARQGQRGARYLLQGWVCCALCGYAYDGKEISPSAAKHHARHYAYYRCVGSDAYRFGGHRLCHNAQVRTDLVDLAVWAEVWTLLAQPARLREEYQRRLHDAGQETHRAALTTTEAQIRKLRQGIGRLIDSYAEGLIEKGEFEPRVARLKERVMVLETEAKDLADKASSESDLRLIIGHLDWETQRGIIRTLVKRVEIDHSQVNVVFRIGPGPLISGPDPTSLQHCGRGEQSPVGEHCAAQDGRSPWRHLRQEEGPRTGHPGSPRGGALRG